MGFLEAVKTVFKKGVTFQGRARRSEYWWWTLFGVLVNFVLEIFIKVFDKTLINLNQQVALFVILPVSLVFLAFLIYAAILGFSLTVRRLHDMDRSGWWCLLNLTIIGIFVLLYWYMKKGTTGPNRFGPDPLATEK